jgi:hypothetical protein
MRLYVVLLLTQTAVVMQGPPYFHHYAAFVAVPLCLVLAAAVARVGVLARSRCSGADASASARGRPGRPQLVAAAGTCVLLVALYCTTLGVPTGSRFPGRELAPAVADRPCVVTDDPTVLAALNVLTRDLRRGCPLVVDVFGLATDRFDMQWRGALPTDNPRWQRSMSAYLESGSATVVVIPHDSGLNADTIARLARLPVLAEHGGYQVRQGTGAAATSRAVGVDRDGG